MVLFIIENSLAVNFPSQFFDAVNNKELVLLLEGIVERLQPTQQRLRTHASLWEFYVLQPHVHIILYIAIYFILALWVFIDETVM